MASLNVANRLSVTLAAVCPILGVSIGTPGNVATVRIDFDPTATAAQRTAAQSALTSFDWSDAAQSAFDDAQHPERTTIRQAAANAIAANTTFINLASPTNAQLIAQAKALTQQNNAIIKRLIQLD